MASFHIPLIAKTCPTIHSLSKSFLVVLGEGLFRHKCGQHSVYSRSLSMHPPLAASQLAGQWRRKKCRGKLGREIHTGTMEDSTSTMKEGVHLKTRVTKP